MENEMEVLIAPLRFISKEQLAHGCEAFRMTSVGHKAWKPTRHERILSAVDSVMLRWPQLNRNAVYKDLETNLNWGALT
jgi:hypothetical protein